MAEFSFLHPLDDDLIEPLDSVPFWQSRHHLDAFVPNPNPTTGENDSITAVDGDNQVNYVTLDLFPHGVDQSDIPLELDLLARFDGGGNLGFRVPVGSGSEEDENEIVEMDLNPHERQIDAVEVIDMDEDFDVSSVRNNLELERSVNDFLEVLFLDDFAIFEPDDEMLFWQPAENEIRGTPPASKTSVENLESVVLTEEDVENDNALCAVCVDGMPVGERAKQLPCSHRYHGDCIVRWLGIRNTCPVCRYELPTDDPDHADVVVMGRLSLLSLKESGVLCTRVLCTVLCTSALGQPESVYCSCSGDRKTFTSLFEDDNIVSDFVCDCL